MQVPHPGVGWCHPALPPPHAAQPVFKPYLPYPGRMHAGSFAMLCRGCLLPASPAFPCLPACPEQLPPCWEAVCLTCHPCPCVSIYFAIGGRMCCRMHCGRLQVPYPDAVSIGREWEEVLISAKPHLLCLITYPPRKEVPCITCHYLTGRKDTRPARWRWNDLPAALGGGWRNL